MKSWVHTFSPQQMQIDQFRLRGFICIQSLLDTDCLSKLHQRFDLLFQGHFETGTRPDEVNWQKGHNDESLTRQICNAWKADHTIANIVLNEQLARCIATFAGWPGARLIQDNVLWKPPGARSLGYHRDDDYIGWYAPAQMLSCWLALDDTSAEGGTLEFATGSHRWDTLPQDNLSQDNQFHAPQDYRKGIIATAKAASKTLDIAYVEVPAGGGAFHHGGLWHGSDANKSNNHRRALVMHCASSEACLNPERFSEGIGPIYSRYRHLNDNVMDENHFPILWREDGYRTPGI